MTEKVCIVSPKQYSAWPQIGSVGDMLLCIYTVADRHSATEARLYMKRSHNGTQWTVPEEIFTEKSGVRGVTGLGNDSFGNLLLWFRDGSPGVLQTTLALHKIDCHGISEVCKLDFALGGGHIGNIFKVEGVGLFAFYNTYGLKRSWGVLKSCDDGRTWQQMQIEAGVDKPECPVEIDGVYIGGGRILALGRKDSGEGNIAMFQICSSDFGKTWTKTYTNITDSLGSSPGLIFDSHAGKLFLYYLQRGTGELKRRVTDPAAVWTSPLRWSPPEILLAESARGEDTGNVKVMPLDNAHLAVYYAGTSETTGVFGAIIKD